MGGIGGRYVKQNKPDKEISIMWFLLYKEK